MKPVAPSPEPAALDAEAAARYLGFDDKRWLDDAPIARVDVRKPGARRPLWRWRRRDLDRFLHARLVAPGTFSPFSS